MRTSTNRRTPQNFETALVQASESDLFRPVDASDRQRIEELVEEHARLRDQIHAVAQVMADKTVSAEVRLVLEALGGVRSARSFRDSVVFDFAVSSVIEDVVATGTIPDQKAYQYYPTPPNIAEIVTELAEIEPHHRVLEPSAGTGHLVADLDPKQVTCVEISERHCQVLRARGIEDVIRADFLDCRSDWARECLRALVGRCDRVVMNPPFSGGRWRSHLEEAIRYVRPGGRLVAVLPASADPKSMVDGDAWEVLVTTPMPFPGTSIKVIVAAIVAK